MKTSVTRRSSKAIRYPETGLILARAPSSAATSSNALSNPAPIFVIRRSFRARPSLAFFDHARDGQSCPVPTQAFQIGGDFVKDGCPVVQTRLPITARRWIPGAIGSIQQPSPVRNVLQRNPDRFSQCARQVGNRCIAGHNQVQILDDRSRVGEGSVIVDFAKRHQAMPIRKCRDLLHALPLLQTDQVNLIQPGERLKLRQWYRSAAVCRCQGIALPAYADADAGGWKKTPPYRDFAGIGIQIR